MTGLGFSAEDKYVSQLPAVPAEFKESNDVIVVDDSKEGWAQAYREFIATLFRGEKPRWDLRRLRPEGARLKTFGGRSSGPGPLNELFEFTASVFFGAAGRKLTSIEAHDIMCKIGSVVVVGGVRRSALISLSDLSDEQMRHAKDGAFWEHTPHRSLANNSAVYKTKPSREEFDVEWAALVASGSGERGIFNLEAAKAHVPERRDAEQVAGTNPCLTADTWVMTNHGPRQIGDIIGKKVDLGLNGKLYESTGFFETGTKDVYRLTLDNGMSVRATDNHRIMTEDGWKELGDISVNDRVALSFNEGASWDGDGNFDEGYLLGVLVGDGTFASSARIDVWSDKGIEDQVVKSMTNLGIDKTFKESGSVAGKKSVVISELSTIAARFGIYRGNKVVTPLVEMGSSDFYRGFLRGYFDADGSAQGSPEKGQSIRLDSISRDNVTGVQRMLSRLGIVSKVYFDRHPGGIKMMPVSDGELAPYSVKPLHTVVISRDSMRIFMDVVGFSGGHKRDRLEKFGTGERGFYSDSKFSKVVSIEFDGVETVYDATVPEVESFDANGIHVHNCGEILLRSKGFCNLTEVIIESDDTLEDLKAKVALAAKIGTWQSTLTNFPYLREDWKKNAEEERLLGVSLTGQMGHPVLNGKSGKNKQISWLKSLKNVAVRTNEREAARLGINPSAAITTVKPSGTVSQLTMVSSGMHAWHDPYYIRTVRGANTDPLTQFMKDAGIPAEPDITNPHKTTVFSFPMKAPEGALVRSDMSAIDQLEQWLVYKTYWTEHSPSVTVSVKADEWDEVGNWVFNHFDMITGVSFLPHSEHVYEQAPYQTISKEEYEEAQANMPDNVSWDMLSVYELEDTTTGTQQLACVAGECSIVDLVSAELVSNDG